MPLPSCGAPSRLPWRRGLTPTRFWRSSATSLPSLRTKLRALSLYLERRAVNNIEILHITPDRGLCGGLHGNLNGMVGQFILSAQAPVRLVCVGRKGRDFMVRYGRDVRATFMNIGGPPHAG